MNWFALTFGVVLLSSFSTVGFAASGPFLKFDLTLEQGTRKEAFGPFFYDEQKETQRTWAIPPLFAHTTDPSTDSEEYDVAYPLLTYDRYGQQYRWQFLQLFSLSGGPTQLEPERHRLTLFPFYFQQRSSDTNQNYTALLPFYGRIRDRLFRDEVFFVAYPFYIESRKKDVRTRNYFYPFVHKRTGRSLEGWQVWPFVGRESKGVTTRTNGFGDVETIPGHESRFVMWPFYLDEIEGIGTPNLSHVLGLFPAYVQERSEMRDSTTVLWPLWTYINDRDKKYREWQTPWPFVVKARGEGKTTTRVFPFFGHARNESLQNDFYLWPIYKRNRVTSEPLDRTRTRLLYFLYSDIIEKNTESKSSHRRVDCWPLYTWQRDFTGNSTLQIMAPLEPFLVNNKSIERDYSHVWSFWRGQKNPRTGAASYSLFWNLYRRETTPTAAQWSLFFGLIRHKSARGDGVLE